MGLEWKDPPVTIIKSTGNKNTRGYKREYCRDKGITCYAINREVMMGKVGAIYGKVRWVEKSSHQTRHTVCIVVRKSNTEL